MRLSLGRSLATLVALLAIVGCRVHSDANAQPRIGIQAATALANPQPTPSPLVSESDTRPDGAALTLILSNGARITVYPVRRDGPEGQRCEIGIADGHAPSQIVMTLPSASQAKASGSDDVPENCLGLKSLGRVPAKAGSERIGLIYTAFSGEVLTPDNSYVVVLVLVQGAGKGAWVLDDTLSRAAYENEIKNIHNLRRFLLSRKK